MKWFRHYSDASEDEVLSGIRDRLGTEGYGAWWLILEAISRQIDKKPRDFAEYSIKKWRKITGISPKKLQKFLSFLSKNGKVFVENSEKDGIKYIKIRVPKILEIADEYTKKAMRQGQKSDKNPENIQKKSDNSPEKIPLDKIRLDKKRKDNNTSNQKQKIIFNFDNEKWENIKPGDIIQWREAYPACDIELELKQMRQWLLSNKKKGKKKNYRRFITNWLTRSQEKGGTKKGNYSGETETQRLAREMRERSEHD